MIWLLLQTHTWELPRPFHSPCMRMHSPQLFNQPSAPCPLLPPPPPPPPPPPFPPPQ
jgi:hypothetical protein